MIKSDTFKLTCYNCGTTIGILKFNMPIEAEAYDKGISQIAKGQSIFRGKIYCLDCLNEAMDEVVYNG